MDRLESASEMWWALLAPGGRCLFATPDWFPGAAYVEGGLCTPRLQASAYEH